MKLLHFAFWFTIRRCLAERANIVDRVTRAADAVLYEIPELVWPRWRSPGLSACEKLARMGAISPKDRLKMHERKVGPGGVIVKLFTTGLPAARALRSRLDKRGTTAIFKKQ